MGQHRLDQPALRGPARARPGIGKARHRPGQPLDRAGKVRRRAAIDTPAGGGLAGDFLERAADGLLDGVIDLDIFAVAAQPPVQGQKPRMLARAVVVKLAGRAVRTDQPLAFLGIARHVAAATQVRLGKAQRGEPRRDAARVDRRALMACACQGQLLGAQPRRVGRPAFDQRQRLDHLARGSRKDHRPRLAPGLDDPVGVRDHHMPQMRAFAQPAAPQFDQPRRSHGRSSSDNRAIPPGRALPGPVFALSCRRQVENPAIIGDKSG